MRRGIVLSFSAAALICGSAAPSFAQMPRGMSGMLQRKYDILQQQANTERMRAETERMQAENERTRAETAVRSTPRAPAHYESYVVAASGDPLAGTDATTFRLGNGAIMRFSGVLWPSEWATCIAYCRFQAAFAPAPEGALSR